MDIDADLGRDVHRLTILYISQIDVSRPYTGSATRIQDTLRFLGDRHEVHLVYVLTPPGAAGADVPQQLPSALASAIGVARGGLAAKVFNMRLFRQADRIARRRPADLVITEFGEAGIYGLALRALRGIPFVYMTENVEGPLHLQRAPPTLPRRAMAVFLSLIERLSARCAALVTCCNAADAEVFRGWAAAPERVKVLPVGFRPSQFNPHGPYSDGPPKLLFLGNLTYEPNREAVQFIVDQVMDRVLEQRPDVVFQFVGVHEPGLEAMAPRAEFTGFVDDVSQYLKRARLVLVPVVIGGGMRIKTIEALACGKMVIATGVGAEGIDIERLRRIRTVDRTQFVETILEELESGAADDGVDYPHLEACYSINAIMRGFEAELISAALAGPRYRRSSRE